MLTNVLEGKDPITLRIENPRRSIVKKLVASNVFRKQMFLQTLDGVLENRYHQLRLGPPDAFFYASSEKNLPNRSESGAKMDAAFQSAVKLAREGVDPWLNPVFIALLICFPSFDRRHDRFCHAAIGDKVCTRSTHFLQEIPAGAVNKAD